MVLACSDQVPSGGEGRVGTDLYVATPHYRAVLRYPRDALTLSGVGGLTLLDLARWDGSDLVHEVAPLIDGGWLSITDWAVGARDITVTGQVTSLPDQAIAEGREVTVSWQFDPSEPRLHVEGATGWYVHGSGAVERVGRSLVRGNTVLLAEGEVTDDLGGALRFGQGGLWLDSDAEIWAWRGEQVVGGSVDGDLELWAGDALWGRLPGGTVATEVPAALSHGRAVAEGRAPGPLTPLGDALDLQAGPQATIDLTWATTGPTDASLTWVHDDGRTGQVALAAPGAEIPVGAGGVTITADAGPTWVPQTVVLSLEEDAVEPVELTFERRFEPGSWAAVGLARPSDRARSHRGSDASVLAEAAAAGLDYVAVLAEDDTTEIEPVQLGQPQLVGHGGTLLTGDGWRIEAWPVRLSDKKNGHGTLQFPVDDPTEALQLIAGGASRLRTLRVDLATLAMLGAPHEPDQAPHAVALERPDPELLAWADWFRWLDAGRLLVPTGPVTWVAAADPTVLTEAEVDAALRRGAVQAGSGEQLVVHIDGLRPGDLAPVELHDTSDSADSADTGTVPPTLHVEAVSDGLLQLVVVGSSGVQWATAPALVGEVPLPPLDSRWVVVVGLGPDAWVTTGPIWLDPPR